MTARYYGFNRGDIEVAVGTATTSKNVELVVQDGVAGLTKRDIDEALIRITGAVLQDRGTAYP
jgi:hypothetical protein